jgi:hypothetical protein
VHLLYDSSLHVSPSVIVLLLAPSTLGLVTTAFSPIYSHSFFVLLRTHRRKPLDAVLRPGPARSSMSGARTLEDVIRWGSSELFASMPDAAEPAAAAAAGTDAAGEHQQQLLQGAEGAAAAGGDVEMKDAAAAGGEDASAAAAAAGEVAADADAAAKASGSEQQQQQLTTEGSTGKSSSSEAAHLITYTPEQIQQILDGGAAACAAAITALENAPAPSPRASDSAAAAGSGSGGGATPGGGAAAAVAAVPADLGAGLDMALVRLWPDVEKRVDDDAGETGLLLCLCRKLHLFAVSPSLQCIAHIVCLRASCCRLPFTTVAYEQLLTPAAAFLSRPQPNLSLHVSRRR